MTDGSVNERTSRILAAVAVLLVAMAVVGAADLYSDSPRVWRSVHGWIELAFSALAIVAAAVLGSGWLRSERSLAEVQASLERHRGERDAWQARAKNALQGLGEAMDAQFDAWALTPTEKDTALFLLKGYSHKEIAALTKRSERTIRQHAVNVYRKSALAGRAELAAFFFEDMLLPGGDGRGPAVQGRTAGSDSTSG